MENQTNEIFGASRIAAALKKDIKAAMIIAEYNSELKKVVDRLEELIDAGKVVDGFFTEEEITKAEESLQSLKEIKKRLNRTAVTKKFGL